MDDNELDNFDNRPEEVPEEGQQEKTNIDQTIVIIDTPNPDADIPNPRKDAGVIRRRRTQKIRKVSLGKLV